MTWVISISPSSTTLANKNVGDPFGALDDEVFGPLFDADRNHHPALHPIFDDEFAVDGHLEEDRAGFVAVGLLLIDELLDLATVEFGPTGLKDDVALPLDAQPVEAVFDRLGVFGLGAEVVGVLDAEDKLAAHPLREEEVHQRRATAADVEVTGRAGGEAGADDLRGLLGAPGEFRDLFKG
jgi:hypothetical protein